MEQDRGSIVHGRTMLETIIAILVLLWILGFALHIAGGLVHILLVLAVIVLILRLIKGRSRTV